MTEKTTRGYRAQGRIVGALEPPTVQPEAPWASAIGRSVEANSTWMALYGAIGVFLIFIGC